VKFASNLMKKVESPLFIPASWRGKCIEHILDQIMLEFAGLKKYFYTYVRLFQSLILITKLMKKSLAT